MKKLTTVIKAWDGTGFRTVCPKCKAPDVLAVISGVFSGRIPLTTGGFDFSEARGEFNTEDEIVQCQACDHRMPMAECLLR